ncbi:MAG: hypothetical protein COV76_01485 [Candidatus Omnitrophica bacterium CG11_big_fil_rev_8_21_14_0_20_64_10]|nr:MAG: hypothetical protein COV76_01485 [Candidatus Omnitrophica bacterium CG11_big_fil_rev_8_21_14_0_20_64_10]
MRILITHPFGIGDLLFSLPLVRAVKQRFPEGRLVLLCNERTEALAQAWPEVDETIRYHKDALRAAWKRSRIGGLREIGALADRIRKEQFDLQLDLSLGWQLGGLGLWAGIPRRVGLNFRGRGRFLTDSLPIHGFDDRPVAVHYFALLNLLPEFRPAAGHPPAGPEQFAGPIPIPEPFDRAGEDHLKNNGWNPAVGPMIALVPGGGASWGERASLKQWPVRHYAALIDALQGEGRSLALIGDPTDELICRDLLRRSPRPPILLPPAPDLMTLAAILRRCRLVIGNDSGPLHLAAAVGTPTVTIFGPVDGSVYGPFPPGPQHRILSKGLACRPCYRGFRIPPCPWENRCLTELPPETVLAAARSLLDA